jgi:predicted secreted Zn-dependent protease
MISLLVTLLHQVRRTWLALAILAILLPSVQAVPVTAMASTDAMQHSSVAAPVIAPVVGVTQSDTAIAAPPTPSPAAPAPQACTPPAFNLPAPLALSGQPTGLSEATDSTTYYRIYGNTTAQIETQLQQCPALTLASGSFGAVTGGNVSWHYSWIPNGNGVCTISTVKVGLHLNMILPAWEPTGAASEGLAAQWQNLIHNLVHHENGHVAIYQQYAHQLLQDLQSLPGTSCTDIAAYAEAKAAATIAALNAANSTYDIHTHHGVSQGVALH